VWVQTGVAGDRDMVNKIVTADGTAHSWFWNYAVPGWSFEDPIRMQDNIYFSSAYYPRNDFAQVMNISSGNFIELRARNAAYPDVRIAPMANGEVSIGVVGQGNSATCYGDLDIIGNTTTDTLQMDAVYPSVIEISAATYTATASIHTILLTDTCAVTLPLLSVAYDSVSAVTGYGLILYIKATNISDCTVDGSGTEEIDGSDVAITLSPLDALMIQATRLGWYIL